MRREDKEEITQLFRSRLTGAEMPVRAGFWEELNKEVSACRQHRKIAFFRVASAASVLLVLAASSAAFWLFSPKEEIEKAFTELTVSNTGSLEGDHVVQTFAPIPIDPIWHKPTVKRVGVTTPCDKVYGDEDSISVTFSLSFNFTSLSNVYPEYDPLGTPSNVWRESAASEQNTTVPRASSNTSSVSMDKKAPKWGIKTSIGTMLPATDNHCYRMPVVASVTIERVINKYLGVEAGLQYTHLRSQEEGLNYIGIPVKVNFNLAETSRINLYASVGGVVDKCIVGAPYNDFEHEPVQLALTAALGVRYQINERLALFAEPGVSHHFKTRSGVETVRTQRPTNFYLLGGLRMTY